MGKPERDEDLDRFFDGVIGVVEANSFETSCLWERWHQRQKVSWVQNPGGTGRVVGSIGGKVIFLSLLTNTVKGYKILFIDPTSQAVDHEVIEEWLKAVLPATALRSDGRLNKTDANNFHNIFPYEEHRRKSMVEGIE